ncbi:exported hypothetical protein [Candidatus Zixiibacteriota bacterium]|nr:exported hypothetical protein [candidate division Zixibacteria bacterium]
MKALLLFLSLIFLIGCSSSNKSEPVKLTDGAAYFPIADGDTWYFSAFGGRKVVRTVSGDTTINSLTCKRILENDTTQEAWSVDAAGFKTHLLIRDHWFDPPLLIPFNLEQGKPYSFSSTVYFIVNDTTYQSPVEGTLTFDGYVNKTVPAGTFGNVIKLHYLPDDYSEFYGKGVGLLDNGDYVLDSAFIDSVWYK